MDAPLKILLLEDTVADAELLARTLKQANISANLHRVQTKPDFLQALDDYAPDVILSDHTLPNFDGLSALDLARKKLPNTPFIFVSATLGEDRAVESLKHGASDYVIKNDLRRLPPAIHRALEEKRLRREREIAVQRMRTSEAMFKSLAEQAPVGIMLTDAQGKFTFCNRQWCDIAGLSVDEVLDADIEKLFHPDDKDRVIAEMQQMFQDRRQRDIQYRMIRPSGEVRFVTARGTSRINSEGELLGFIGLLIDDTEKTLSAQKIQRLARIQEVLSGINSTIVRVTEREKLCRDVCHIAVNKGKFRFSWIALVDPASLELSHATALGDDPEALAKLRSFHPKRVTDLSTPALAAYTSRQVEIVDPITSENFSSPWLEIIQEIGIQSIAHLPLISGGRIFGVLALTADSTGFFDQEELRLLNELAEDIAFALDHLEKNERLNYLAYYDALTDLPNRTLFFDHLKQQIADATQTREQLAVLSVDIERFRHINESFGERAGDALLQEVARRFMARSNSKGLLGRLGSDGFGSIIPRVQDATALAHMIDHEFSEWMTKPFRIADQEIIVPFKVGVAIFPADGRDADVLLQNANAALKQAKASGEQVSFYAQEINARVTEQLYLETRLRNAVEQQQFVLHYQPKVNLKTGRVGSVEALIRWQDPDRGLIPPLEFIPLLEETGLIYNVGMWAMQQAFDDHARMRELFPLPPTIAVNVSALQLQRKSFYDDILRVIGQAGDDQHGIDIEITESLIMRNIEDNILKLKEVCDRNVHIAIDDFGTGYSSLAYIAKLPIDILKIDRSFIVKMAASDEDHAIVSAIVTLAHSLDLKVVAEGVETEEQAKMLRQIRCDEAQGYLFCRPLPLEALIQRLAVSDRQLILEPPPGAIT